MGIRFSICGDIKDHGNWDLTAAPGLLSLGGDTDIDNTTQSFPSPFCQPHWVCGCCGKL